MQNFVSKVHQPYTPSRTPSVPIDLEASEAEKAALETRISLLKRERRRLEAAFTRVLAAGKPPPPISIMQQPSLVESAASAASASDAGPHHGSGPLADSTNDGCCITRIGGGGVPAASSRVNAASSCRRSRLSKLSFVFSAALSALDAS